ncbi:MAG: hypothetical protein ACRDUW_10920, partial [Pseudonocardiaceae bacterium]
AANSSLTVRFPGLFEGQITGCVRLTGGTNFTLLGEDLDDLGAFVGLFDFVSGVTVEVNVAKAVQATPCQYVISNPNAAPITVQYSLHQCRYS